MWCSNEDFRRSLPRANPCHAPWSLLCSPQGTWRKSDVIFLEQIRSAVIRREICLFQLEINAHWLDYYLSSFSIGVKLVFCDDWTMLTWSRLYFSPRLLPLFVCLPDNFVNGKEKKSEENEREGRDRLALSPSRFSLSLLVTSLVTMMAASLEAKSGILNNGMIFHLTVLFYFVLLSEWPIVIALIWPPPSSATSWRFIRGKHGPGGSTTSVGRLGRLHHSLLLSSLQAHWSSESLGSVEIYSVCSFFVDDVRAANPLTHHSSVF